MTLTAQSLHYHFTCTALEFLEFIFSMLQFLVACPQKEQGSSANSVNESIMTSFQQNIFWRETILSSNILKLNFRSVGCMATKLGY